MSTQVNRRRFLAGASLGISAVILAACQPKIVEVTKVVEKQVEKVVKETVVVAGTPQVVEKVVTGVPPTPKPKEVDKGPLKIMWLEQTALVKDFQRYSDEKFTPKTGAKVEINIVPGGEFSQKLLSGLAAGAPPDIFRSVNYAEFSQFCIQSVILSLDELIARDKYQDTLATFIPGSLDAGKFKGKQHSIPFGGHPSSFYLFYNKTALNKKGFKLDNKAWKWSDYIQVATAMSDPANKVFGSWIRLNTEGFLVGLRSLDTDIIDSTGTKSLVGSEQARPFFQMAYKLINEANVAPRPSDVGDWKPPFAASKIMMANDNGYRESFLREMVKDFEFDTFLTPNEGKKPRGCFVCDFQSIVSFSKHIDLAWEWVKGQLTVEEGISRVKNARHIPLPVQAAMLPKGETISPQYEFYIREWLATPPLPFPQPANGRASEVDSLLGKGFDVAWLKTKPLDEVIKSVDDEMQKILAKAAV